MSDVRIITEPLGGSALSRHLQHAAGADAWMPAAPRSADDWRARADRCRLRRDWPSVWRALAPALAARGPAALRLARVIDGGGIVVTTGQQPGLFGGPVYTWSKAVSALALADALEEATGVPTAAVFWAATDDADFEEASSTVLGRRGRAEVVRATLAPDAGTPMSLAPLGELSTALEALRDSCASAADARPLDAAVRAYGDPARTAGTAFVQLLRELLEPLGIPVLDASHDAVHQASRETLALALHRADAIDRAVTARTRAIRDGGFAPQVDHLDGMSLVFERTGDIKRRLPVADALGRAPAGVLSPNVLLRPVVEQAVLPTVAYVAGPGELAYFAQVGAVADALGVPAPLPVPRWSCTLVEPHIDDLLRRYDARADDLARPDALETRLARAAVSAGSSAALDSLRGEIVALAGRLAPEALPLGLDAAVQGAVQGLQHRLDRLERRLVAGVKRRETAMLRDVGTLRAALYPLGIRQERALNLLPLLARHGVDLLHDMRLAARAHAGVTARGG